MTPAELRGVINDAVAVYFREAAFAGAFAARWCAPVRVGAADGVLHIRDDEPAKRVPAPWHKTP
jgi:hypothetical protein